MDRILLGILPAGEKLNKVVVGINDDERWRCLRETAKSSPTLLDMEVHVFSTGIFSPCDPEERGLARVVEKIVGRV